MAENKEREAPDAEDATARHAADEPTAVWDVNTLRDAGLGDLITKPDSEPPAPATHAAKGDHGPSMVVDEAAAGAAPQAAATPPPPARGAPSGGQLGWGATMGLAAGLGAAVYLLMRLFAE